jgi:hypothetical protein
MKKLSLGLGLLLAASVAACAATSDDHSSGASDGTHDDELNESKALGMTDVTILYPTPDKWELVDDMLGPTSEDARGELLPASLFAQIANLPAPKMISGDGTEIDPQKKLFATWANNFAYLRVAGVRLDPCFGETSNLGATSCLSTIRLVGQFLFPRSQNDSRPLFDSAASVHLFYKISQTDFAALAKEMLALRVSTGLPLQKALVSPQQNGVHPTLQQEGLRGAYATSLKAIILKYAGAQTLDRIAFSVEDRIGSGGGSYGQAQGVADSRWVFGGFEHRNGALLPLNISSLGDYTGLQTVDSFPNQRGDKNLITVTPAITVSDNVLGAFNPTPQPNGGFALTDLEKGRDAARKLQNPNDYTTKSSDCASCHMAKHALIPFANQPSTNALDFKSYTFRLDHTHEAFGPFRMFGWEQGQPIISARVVNETANVLEFLNKNVLH